MAGAPPHGRGGTSSPTTWRRARGLAAAHAVGLVHRDFKPENVLLDKDGRALVTDFGLARSVLAPDLPGGPSSDRADGSSTGVAMGTPGYIAPEQYRGEKVDARADIFSFCVALYEARIGLIVAAIGVGAAASVAVLLPTGEHGCSARVMSIST